jgi:hypothetical protein
MYLIYQPEPGSTVHIDTTVASWKNCTTTTHAIDRMGILRNRYTDRIKVLLTSAKYLNLFTTQLNPPFLLDIAQPSATMPKLTSTYRR